MVDLRRLLRHGAVAGAERDDRRPVPGRSASSEHFGLVFEKGSALVACVNQALAELEGRRHARAAPAQVARDGDAAPGPEVAAGRVAAARSLGAAPRSSAARARHGASSSRSPARSSSSALIVALVVTLGRAGRRSSRRSSTGEIFDDSFPEIRERSSLNVQIFLIAEAVILVFALVIAILRSLPGPVFFPLRALAIVYTDLFRGVPTILVIYILGFGAPALQLSRRADAHAALLGDRGARARLLGLRRRGLPRRDRVGAPEPGGGRALARALARRSRCASWSSRRPCAASSRRS